jgi:hypothetical protein
MTTVVSHVKRRIDKDLPSELVTHSFADRRGVALDGGESNIDFTGLDPRDGRLRRLHPLRDGLLWDTPALPLSGKCPHEVTPVKGGLNEQCIVRIRGGTAADRTIKIVRGTDSAST